jgi:rsbT co-antagonist protein RsbR
MENVNNSFNYERFFELHLDLLCIASMEGYFLRINAAWETTLGYTIEDLKSVQFLEFIHPDDLQKTLDVMGQLATGVTLLNFTNRYRHKDGSFRTIEWRSHLADGLIYAAARDITERVAKEENLRQEQSRMKAIIESQTNYMLRTDLEGNYTYTNQKYIDDYGWIHAKDNLSGQNCLISISPNYQAAVAETVAKCIAAPNTTFQVEMEKPLEGGSVATTLWDFVCLTNADGSPSEIQCLGINITDRKRREMEQSERQQFTLLEMSTPITQLWDGILLLPLVGIMSAARAQSIMTSVLKKISETQAKVFILDISGVAVVDTEVANHFIKLSKATRLMGCACTMSGISPAVSQTIVELGIQIEEINTTGTMRDALEKALELTGTRLVNIAH